jgi:hypothetical protein
VPLTTARAVRGKSGILSGVIAAVLAATTAVAAQEPPPPPDGAAVQPQGWGEHGPCPDCPPEGMVFVPLSSARLMVTPRETEVFVDGRRQGTVEGFSGFTERMRIESGGHELVLYLDGYKTVRQKILFEPGATYKIKWQMVKLGPGETSGPRPVAPKPPEPPEPRPRARDIAPAPPPAPRAERSPGSADGFGTLVLRVQPAEVVVIIDGERWEGPSEHRRLSIELGEGTHDVDIRKDGYDSYSTRVRVRRGETTTLNVGLPRTESH